MNAIMVDDGLARGGPVGSAQAPCGIWRAQARDGNLTDLEASVMDGCPVHALTKVHRCRLVHVIAHICRPMTEPAQHQSAAWPDRALRRFRRGARVQEVSLFIAATTCTPAAAHLSSRQDHRRRDHGSACRPFPVPRRRDRRPFPYWDGATWPIRDLSVLSASADRGHPCRADHPVERDFNAREQTGS